MTPSQTAGVAKGEGNEDMFGFLICLAARSAQCVAFVPLAKRWPLRNWVNVMPNGYSAAAGPITPSPIKLAMIPLFGKLNRVMGH